MPVSEESLKLLNKTTHKTRIVVEEGKNSETTDSSKESGYKTSIPGTDHQTTKSSINPPFHIVPNEVYNIDQKIDQIIEIYSHLPFHDLQTNYSVYNLDHEFRVLGLTTISSVPELVEVTPAGGKITWSILPVEIENCEVRQDEKMIKKVGEEDPKVYSLMFLQDLAHLYLLVCKMKDFRAPESVPDPLSPSDRIFSLAVSDHAHMSSPGFISFPSYCFCYSQADEPIPVVISVTDTDIFLIKIENHDILNLNQDILSQLLGDDIIILFREAIVNVRQVRRSYYQHTVRIEFKETDKDNPFGSSATTFTLIGYNNSDIETFIDTISSKLDSSEIPTSDVIINEDEDDLRLLKRLLRLQDLGQTSCIPIRLDGKYFRSLIMTETYLYVLEEDFVRWPPPCFVRHSPLTTRYSVLSQIRIRLLFGVTQFSEIYQGSYVVAMGFYTNLKTFEKGQMNIYMSSYAIREQVIGHIGRVWKAYHYRDLIVSEMRKFEGVEEEVGEEAEEEMEEEGEEGNHKLDLNMLASSSLERLQRFTGEELGDTHNILYHVKTFCITSKHPRNEVECVVIITTHHLHLLHSRPPCRPLKVGEPPDPTRLTHHLGVLYTGEVTDVGQIVFGIFEQKLRFEFEFGDDALITFMTRDVKVTRDLYHAIIESLHCEYLMDNYESSLITRKGRELSLVHLDEDRLDELRYTIAKRDKIDDYNTVQILSYHLLYQDVSQITCHHNDEELMITMVITNTALYLINEDNVFWPLPHSNRHRMPQTVQFTICESIQLDDVMCIHYTHFTSSDLILLCENSTENHQRKSSVDDEYLMIEEVEKLGKTLTLHTATYQQRDSIIRTLSQLKNEDLPVKKLDK